MQNKLTCQSFEQRIHQLLDERATLSGDHLLMEHSNACGDCRQLMLDYEDIAVALPLLESDQELADLAVRSPGRFQNRRNVAWSSMGWPLAVAAGLLLMVSATWNTDSRDPGLAQNRGSSLAMSERSGMTMSDPLSITAPATAPAEDSSPQISPVVVRNENVQHREKLIHQIVFYQPPTFVEMAQQTPQLVHAVQAPSNEVWDRFSRQLDPLNTYLQYSGELPGIRKVHCSLNITLELLQRSLSNSKSSVPDLGWLSDSSMVASI